MVEFALVLPLLLLLMFGIIEFGRLLFVYSGVVTASREAARYGSAAGEVSSGTLRFMDCDGIENAARRVAILGDITAINISYDAGPGTANLSGGCPPDPSIIQGGRHRVIVEVQANYQPVVPLININPFNITAKSARTIFSNIVVGRFPQNPAHVAALENAGTGSGWWARVRITVVDELGAPVQNATVIGKWISKSGTPGNNVTCENEQNGTLPPGLTITTKSCSTDVNGVCEIEHSFTGNPPRAIFVIADIFHVEKAYDPTANVVSCIDFIKP